MVIFDVAESGMTAAQVSEAMKRERILIHAFGKTQIRLVTHLDVSGEDIEVALEAFKKVFR